MKRRLFWKILLAFWVTLFGITQGLWVLFELNRSDRPPPPAFLAQQVGPVILAAGTEAVTRDGPAALDAFVARLPAEERGRVTLAPAGSAPADPGDTTTNRISREVVGPGGQAFVLSYRYPTLPPPPVLRRIPVDFLIVGLVGGLLFSAALAWYMTEPISKLRTGFDRLARGDLEVRLASSIGRRRDEIADLGRDFDAMAQRLQQLVSARDRLLHDVSHELRSPLARLQLAIGLGRQGKEPNEVTFERVEREAQRLEALVAEVLELARAEHGQSSRDDYFDLAGIVSTVAEDACFEAEASQVRIHLRSDMPGENERPLMTGNAELVHRAMDNVMRNALRFSSAGQVVDIAMAYDRTSRCYRVEICDQGPGVPESDLATIFDPFVRGENDRAGLGLGLSIASRAVAAHHGTIAARNREGGGLAITMTFPAAA